MAETSEIQKALTVVADVLKREMSAQLVRQGHKVTGKLLNSLLQGMTVRPAGEGFIRLQSEIEGYGVQMDIGRRPGSQPPVTAIAQWVRNKGIATGDIEVMRAAWAISKAIAREGIPTSGSRRMGKKLGWLTDTLKDREAFIEQQIGQGGFVEIDNLIQAMVNRTNTS